MTANVPNRITAFQDGRFVTVARPEWWDVATTCVYAEDDAGQPARGHVAFGNEYGNEVTAYDLDDGRGRLVQFFSPGGACVEVWAPTMADYLELATTRFGAYLALSNASPVAATLRDVSNTLIAFARHGHGDHVDRYGGESAIDLQRDHNEQVMAARERAKQASAGGASA